jgi:hypothetical protein
MIERRQDFGGQGAKHVQARELASWGGLIGTIPASKVPSSIPFLTPSLGDMIVGTDTAWESLAAGTKGEILYNSADSTPDWLTAGASQSILYNSAAGTLAWKAIGSQFQILGKNDSDVLAWLTLVSGVHVSATGLGSNITLDFNGTLEDHYGGTGFSTWTTGDTLYASATDTLAKLSGNTLSTNKFLRSVGDGVNPAAPSWELLVAGDIPDLSGTYQPLDSTLTALSALAEFGAANQVVGANAAGNGFEYKDILAGTGLSVTHSVGGITISQNQVTQGFLYDTASDVAGYKKALTTHSTGAKDNVVATIDATPKLIEEWVTEPGVPGVTFIGEGIWHLHIHAAKTAGTKTVKIYAEFYKRTHPGGVETLLGTTEQTANLAGAETAYDVEVALSEQEVNDTDRPVCKVYGTPGGAGTDPEVTIYYEGDTSARFETPAAGGGGFQSHFADTEFQIHDDADETKIAMFECSGISAGTTRTFTFPDSSGTIALAGALPTAHAILSASHSDTTPAAVTRGAQIVGIGAVPTWTLVSAGSQYKMWTMGANEPAWSGYLLDGTSGGKMNFAVTNNKTLTLTATDSYNLTVPESMTVAGRNVANTFTANQNVTWSRAAAGVNCWVQNTATDGWGVMQALNDALTSASIRSYGSTYATVADRNWVEFDGGGASLAGLRIAVSGVNKPLKFYINSVEVGGWASSAGLFTIPITGSGAGYAAGTATVCQWYQNASDQWRTPNSVQIDDGLGLNESNTVAGTIKGTTTTASGSILTLSNASTAYYSVPLVLRRTTSDTTAVGDGVALMLQCDDDAGTQRSLCAVSTRYSSAVAASYRADFSVFLASGAVAASSKTSAAFRVAASATTDVFNTIIGYPAAIATNATDGFLYIPSCAGAPTGVPTAYTGKIAMIYDSTNNDLYVYNAAWKKVAMV